MKAGGVYVPLDPEHPPSKLHATIEELQIETIVCSSASAENDALRSVTKLIVVDENLLNKAKSYSSHLPCCQVGGQNAALLVFTSGTTGKSR